jgi:hypothetical protein
MTEAEILQNAIQAAQAALSVFSVFLGIVSAYIVGLYLFLKSAPLGLKWIAFFLLTVALLALGALALNLQYLGEGMHTAWQKLPQKMSGMESLGPPVIVRSIFLDGREIAAWIGWGVGFSVYLSLFYMTFIYRWQPRSYWKD